MSQGLGGYGGRGWQAFIVKSICWAGGRSLGMSWLKHQAKGVKLVLRTPLLPEAAQAGIRIVLKEG